ncbi:hypothetical protein BGX26_003460 [Mortierella sp. AD094]|nr:hypothetical protein BGX26_003460 [Mortierella sp. AD094]
MSLLYPYCLASSPSGTELYALTAEGQYLNIGPGSVAPNLLNDNVYLVKANNVYLASDIRSLDWSIVASITRDPQEFQYDHACAVDEAGVFTALAYQSNRNSDPSMSYTPNGLRYDPTSSHWYDIAVSPSLGWNMTYTSQTLTYVNNKLTHMLTYGQADSVEVVLGTIDESTLTLNPSSKFYLPTPSSFTIVGTLLYAFTAFTSPTIPSLKTYELLGPSTNGSPAATRSLDAIAANNSLCLPDSQYATCSFQDSLYIMCTQNPADLGQQPFPSQIFGIQNLATEISLEAAITVTGSLATNISRSWFFNPVAGQQPFAVFSLDGLLNSVGLSGSSRGMTFGPMNVSIPNPINSIVPATSFANSTSTSHTGLIIGVIAGVIVVLCGLALFVYFRRKRRNTLKVVETNTTSAESKELQDLKEETNGTQIEEMPRNFTNNITPNIHNPYPQQPITYSGPQNQMQGIQFSNHPRPNVVTTLTVS